MLLCPQEAVCVWSLTHNKLTFTDSIRGSLAASSCSPVLWHLSYAALILDPLGAFWSTFPVSDIPNVRLGKMKQKCCCVLSVVYTEKKKVRNNWTQLGNMLIFDLLKSSNRIFYKPGGESPFLTMWLRIQTVLHSLLCSGRLSVSEQVTQWSVQSACLYLKLFWSVLSTPHATQTAERCLLHTTQKQTLQQGQSHESVIQLFQRTFYIFLIILFELNT